MRTGSQHVHLNYGWPEPFDAFPYLVMSLFEISSSTLAPFPATPLLKALFPALVGSRVVEHLQIHLAPA